MEAGTISPTPASLQWSMGITTAPTGVFPLFLWGIGKLRGDLSPLRASARLGVFTWSWPRQDVANLTTTAEVQLRLEAEGLPIPPLLEEVATVLSEFSPRIKAATEPEKRELYREIERRWRELLANV